MTPEELQQKINGSVAQSQYIIDKIIGNIANGQPLSAPPTSGTAVELGKYYQPDIAQYQQILGNDPQQFMQLLNSLLQDKNNINMNDQQWSLLNSMLDWYKQQSTNKYNEGLRDEQRQFDSPNQQLERLMATGMSRQAALQMLGQGSAAGSVAAPYASSPASSQLGLSPSETELNKTQKALGIVNSVLGGIASLAGVGINGATAYYTNSFTAANTIAQKQLNAAQEKSAVFNGLVYQAEKAGFLKTAEKSFDTILSQMQNITSEQSPQIYDFMHNGGIDDLMSTPAAYQVASSNYNTRFGNSNLLQSSLQNSIQTDMAEVDLQSALMNFDYQSLQFEDYLINRDLVNKYTMLDFKHKINVLRAQNDPEVIKNMTEQLKNDAAFNACNSALRLRLQSNLTTNAANDPTFDAALQTAFFLDSIGLTGEVGQVVKGVSSAPALIQTGGKLIDTLEHQTEKSSPLGRALHMYKQSSNSIANTFDWLDKKRDHIWWLPSSH